MRRIGETSTVAAVKGGGNMTAGEQKLIIKMNKEILVERVELHNREKETY
jgi:hypothetical protein